MVAIDQTREHVCGMAYRRVTCGMHGNLRKTDLTLKSLPKAHGLITHGPMRRRSHEHVKVREVSFHLVVFSFNFDTNLIILN